MAFKYKRHPHVENRKTEGPVKTTDVLPTNSRVSRFNSKLAIITTTAVGTMWCAYAFAAFDLLALPTALKAGTYGIVQWVASFFLQLVLLSVIMVGQNTSAAASDKRAEQTFNDAEAILTDTKLLQDHMLEQDKVLVNLTAKLEGSSGVN